MNENCDFGNKTRIPRWLDGNPFLKGLISEMYRLAVKHNLDLAADWPGHWQDSSMDWHRQAMEVTWRQLDSQEKETVRQDYKLFEALDGFVDWYYLPERAYPAFVYILDKNGRRVISGGKPATVCFDLKGETRKDALETLDKRSFEFKRWF